MSDQNSAATIQTAPARHRCPVPVIGDSPERVWPNGPYLLDGDLWACECGRRWMARTLWWRRGTPMIWARPMPWHPAWWREQSGSTGQ